MLEQSCEISVSMDLVPEIEAKVAAVKQWKRTAKKAFISKKNPCKLLEVF